MLSKTDKTWVIDTDSQNRVQPKKAKFHVLYLFHLYVLLCTESAKILTKLPEFLNTKHKVSRRCDDWEKAVLDRGTNTPQQF